MKYCPFYLICFMLFSSLVQARQPEGLIKTPTPKTKSNVLKARENCSPATKQIDLEINNVRARLLNGGDMWWDLDKGRYIVPKVVPGSGKKEVSSIFAGAVWVGGYTPAGALKMMAQTYRRPTENDCWPGPLNPITYEAETAECINWDRFFEVSGKNIANHNKLYKASGNTEVPVALIPDDILYYPARGNKFFESKYNFPLPNLKQGLALFYDQNDNRTYEPELGDYPVIDIRNCPPDIYPDHMVFWIYNDAGGVHTGSGGDPIRMEVQVQAFGFQTGDQINDMTFYRYKLINRAPEDIRDCYFAMWIDPDLGCHSDDYIGCDPDAELMYIYNRDATDGSNGCNCTNSTNTYCTEVPILGVDYFRGPLGPKVFARDSQGNRLIDPLGNFILNDPEAGTGLVDTFVEIGMSSFMYYNGNGLGGTPHPNTVDPTQAIEFYYYLTARWKDGSSLTKGGTGYNPGSTDSTKYAYTGAPNDVTGWSMCSAQEGDGDRRTIQASGPMLLTPGAVNELIIGAVWVPEQKYPCPSLSDLLEADGLAQGLFDNCFKLKNGPDAPNVDFVELDKELIMILSNEKGTNNYNINPEDYAEAGIGFPPNVDSLFRFEGYRIFQMAGPDISLNDNTINDPELVREIATVDLKNGVKKLYNWVSVPNPSVGHPKDKVYYPVEKVVGVDNGIKHSFQILEDQFAKGDKALINHKKYYFLAIAYGYNNYRNFDVDSVQGQRMQYCPGRLNIGPEGDGKPYVAVPRPQVYESLASKYGDGIPVTRLDGGGAGHNFLRLKQEMYGKLLDGSYAGVIDYQEGAGPIQVKIINPLKVKNGKFELRFVDAIPNNAKLDPPVTWTLINVNDTNEKYTSEASIDKINEQIIANYGISITIGQTEEAGKNPTVDNGIIGDGLEFEYGDINGPQWFLAQPDAPFQGVNFIKNDLNESSYSLDPKKLFSTLGSGNIEGSWYPYKLVSSGELLTPAWASALNEAVRGSLKLDSLNNVDIVFTKDKSKWTRCMVVETWNPAAGGAETEPTTGNKNFDVKKSPSVGKDDVDGDGYADPDGTGNGFGWFPGYAVDVETGQRLNIFFGENSYYDNTNIVDCLKDKKGVGNDMMWNPTDQIFADQDICGNIGTLGLVFGGHHYIYVTKQAYDSCSFLAKNINGTISARNRAFGMLTWATMPLMFTGTSLTPLGSGNEGLIPNELIVRLRVDNPYNVFSGTGKNNGHPMYQFEISGKESTTAVTANEMDSALDDVNVVPNPYYGFSVYETGQYSNVVKITNLPAKCEINIFSIDGKFVKQYNRDEVPQKVKGVRGITEKQINPDVEWDLTNFKGIPVASGAYLIHIKELTTGEEKILKWFGLARKFDPSGL